MKHDHRRDPRPLWRWWLWCIAFDIWWSTKWEWAARLHSWCILPEWLGYEPGDTPAVGEDPF